MKALLIKRNAATIARLERLLDETAGEWLDGVVLASIGAVTGICADLAAAEAYMRSAYTLAGVLVACAVVCGVPGIDWLAKAWRLFRLRRAVRETLADARELQEGLEK